MRRGRPPIPELLTPREQEVLSLIREGLTNEQIAERLGISESGARYHVSEILSKLGVESRYEAAAWRGDGAASAPVTTPLTARMQLPITRVLAVRPWAVAGLVVAVLALVALAIGVVLKEMRGGVDEQQAASPTSTPGPEVRRMLEREAEARKFRDVIAPDAYLFQMTYFFGRDAEIYNFLYAESDGFVVIHRNTASQQDVWTLTIVDSDAFSPVPLDLSGVVHVPQDIYVASVTMGVAPRMEDCGGTCLALLLEAGVTGFRRWHVYGAFQNSTRVECIVEDAGSLQAMNCGPGVPPFPAPPVDSATPHPKLAADGIREMANLALRLARIFEPEAHLSSLRALDSIGAIPTAYQLGFASPDGSTLIGIFRNGTRWEVEVLGPASPEPQPRLDLSELQKSADEVAEAAEDDTDIHRADIGLVQEGGRLVWEISGASFGDDAFCRLADEAPISELSCEVDEASPTPVP